MSSKKIKTIEETYQKKSQLEHVLHRPSMYIGDTEIISADRWIFDENKMVKKTISFSPGLYKIFDEIFTNATDHSQRDSTMKKIEVTIENGEITISNDGNAIPVEVHKELGKYVPEIIFGEFHTSSNYDDTEARTVGGLNGYGAKLTNAFSNKFCVDICDGKFHFIQTWENNMSIIGKPKITASKKKSYTSISFIPDYSRFGKFMDADLISLLKTRVCEGSAITDKRIGVYFNGEKINIKNFLDYTKLFKAEPIVYEKVNDRWEFAVTLNPYDKFTQVSFVNGISTSEGGTHVDIVVNQIIYKLKEQLEKKHKDINIRPSYIKDNLLIFVNCLVENPTFSSQTKENHITKIAKNKCELSEDIIKKIDKLGITANVIEIAKAKETKSLSKTDGAKKIRLSGIPKLDDANKAGGSEGYKCKLILTEGDSAKASAIAGLSVVGRDYYGVFPLRGKLLNVRDATAAQLLKNEEINCLKKIMGFQQNKEYTDIKSLRYGGIIIFTDADNDGSHIKGLIINFIHTFWPSLLKIDSFISSIVTPIVKVTKGLKQVAFYNQADFITWKESNNCVSWLVKYYKGLGTSTAKEAKEYFSNLKSQTIVYSFTDTTDDDLIKAFKKGFEDSRKEWIKESTGITHSLDHTNLKQTISQFVNNELINFSIADLERSIPNMMDGLKPSQRKVLYGCIKKGLYTDMKVAQLSGYISEHTSYHHGEVSLQGTIINMAQDFVGSNNINLLSPSGQFGCIDPETPVFLWNGIIEKAKNIKIGDKLIGDDGTSRIVEKLTSGIDDMYEIKNGHMDSYIVNSYHILTLCFPTHKHIWWKQSTCSWVMDYIEGKTIKNKSISAILPENKESAYNLLLIFSKSIPGDNTLDINVQEYIKLPISVKHHLKGVLNSKIINWEEQVIDIDPYILGMWLGDGMSDGHAFASIDSELVKSWAIWTDTIGCEICHVKNIPPHECHSFYIRRRGSTKGDYSIGDKLHNKTTCKGCITSSHIMEACDWVFEKTSTPVICNGKNILNNNVVNLNPFKELLKKNNLFKNKHVPHNYIFNSEENRLKILAGIIDTDGCLKNKGNNYAYEISQCNERLHLLESFRIIAGSLGYRAKINICKNNMASLYISGPDLQKIPVKLKRKQIPIITKNCMYHKIEINFIGKGSYCGWNINKNERFLLGDFTITHNTRITGGKDSASPRYIFTKLQPVVKTLFNEHDNTLLDYLDDDGMTIEPKYYIPIIPMLLVNGSEGIGTGYSTNIPCYNPNDIIANLKRLINNPDSELKPMFPWYRGFTGIIELEEEHRYITTGVWKRELNSIIITELPIGKWTQNYKEYLETLVESSEILDYRNNSDDKSIYFKVIFQKSVLDELEKKEQIVKKLKLSSYINTSNMHVFDEMCSIRKISCPEEIIYRFYKVRKEHYNNRKKYLIEKLSSEYTLLNSKIRFIKLVINEEIIIFNKKKDFIVKQISLVEPPLLKVNDTFDYLLDLKIWTLTEEKIKDLTLKMKNMTTELETLKVLSIDTLWNSELESLEF